MIIKLGLLALFATLVACSSEKQAGFSSETTNGFTVVDAKGEPAEGVRVRLFESFDSMGVSGTTVYLDTVLNGESYLELNNDIEGPVSLQLELKEEALFVKDFDLTNEQNLFQLSELLTKTWLDTLEVDKLGLGGTLFSSETQEPGHIVLKAPEGVYTLYVQEPLEEPISNGLVVYGDEKLLYENTLLAQGLLLDDFSSNDLARPTSQVKWGIGKWELKWNSEKVTLNKSWNSSIEINITSGEGLSESNPVVLSYFLDSMGVRFPLDLQEMEKICFLVSSYSENLSLTFLNLGVNVSEKFEFATALSAGSKCFDSVNFKGEGGKAMLFDEIQFEMTSGTVMTLDDLVVYGYNQDSFYQNK